MSLISLDNLRFPAFSGHSLLGITTQAITYSNNCWACAWIVQVPKTGTIEKVRIATTTNSNLAYIRVTLMRVDPTTMLPVRNYDAIVPADCYGGSLPSVGFDPPSSATPVFYDVPLGQAATATKGDLLAIVVDYDRVGLNTSAAATILWTYSHYGYPYDNITRLPIKEGSGTWAYPSTGGGHCPWALIYSNDEIPPQQCDFITAVNSITFKNSSAPNEYGLRFKLPFDARLMAVACQWGLVTNTTPVVYNINLYQGDTLLETYGVQGAYRDRNTTMKPFVEFPGVRILTKDTVYRATIAPTTTDAVIQTWQYPSNDYMEPGTFGGKEFFLCTRNGGAFTDVTDQKPASIAIVLDQVPNASASGGGGGGVYTFVS